MAYLDSADCARRAIVLLNRPATDEVFTVTVTNDVIYDALTEAQHELMLKLGAIVPDALIGSPVLMTSADSGKTWTFGTDTDTAAILAFGHYKVYAQLSDIPFSPLAEDVDFTAEATQIRMPSNTTRSFAAGPYAQFVSPPNVIAAATQPILPKAMRQPMVSLACAKLATFRLKQDPSDFLSQADREFDAALSAIRTRSGMGAAPRGRSRRYTTGDLTGWIR